MWQENTLKEISQSLGESSKLLEKRLSSFSKYQEIPMPTIRDEEWRYTDIGSIKWDSINPKDTTANVSITGSGLEIMKLSEAHQKYPELVENHLGKSIQSKPDKFAFLSSAFWSDGYMILIPKNTKIDDPVTISIESGSLSIVNILIIAQEGSSVKFVEDSKSQGDGLNLSLIEIFAEQNSNVDYNFLQDFSDSYYDLSMKRATLSKDAHVNWNFGSFGGKISKAKIETFFEGPGSHSEQKGVFFGDGGQHIDVITNAFHDVPNTSNNILVRGVLKDSSSSIYRGLIRIEKEAQQTSSYLSEHSLMVGEKALANSIPSLEIEANEVKASHGSTTGKVDEEQIFYLMSRGLSRKIAERLVIEGFFIPVIEKIPSQDIRDKMTQVVNRKMGA